MEHKTKELYFILGIIIILLVGFFLGRFFTTSIYYEQTGFNAENLDSCMNDIFVYSEICGDIEYLIDNPEKQECILSCS